MLAAMSIGTEPTDRRIPFDGLFNVRDLGGYETVDGRLTRWRRLYRADSLNRASGDDIARLTTLGLRTVLDLRTAGELVDRGRFPVDLVPVEYHHLPVLEQIWDSDAIEAGADGVAFLILRYEEMLTSGATSIATAVDMLADPETYPAVFHCAAGKDRTGVLAAVVLGLLGVPHDSIADDYGLSRGGMQAMIEWLKVTRPEALDAMVDQPAIFLDAPPLAMTGLLDLMSERFGSIAGYATSIGINDATVDSMRSLLLD